MADATRQRRRRGYRSASLLAAPVAALAALAALRSGRAFQAGPAQDSAALGRRSAAVALGLPLAGLAAAEQALAGDRDRASMVLGVRKQKMPTILKGYKKLKEAGAITDDFLEEDLKKLCVALNAYGSINRLAEAPDKISKKLEKDVSIFKAAAKEKDYNAAMAALETFKGDIPDGPGKFDWDSTLPIDLGLKGA